ncbi:MAG: hypothetical protein AAGD07_02410 [Planctomycetota bacterium]
MTSQIELILAIQLTVIGLTHLFRPQLIIAFFQQLASHRDQGVMLIALMSLAWGSILVVTHSVWSGFGVPLTLFGYIQLIKAFVFTLVPEIGRAQIASVHEKHVRKLRLAGLAQLLLAAVTAWSAAMQ